ncbi:hypothetical protein [Paenibacillus sp. GCM10012303]|uniref:hypothetical protein n=1 Tax=Paenibacillus sp. GCM10012303 TaxID=3317340 RepID=UPI003606146F
MNHVPVYKQKQVLIGNDSGAESQRYYAFPSIFESGDGNIIIAYKNGTQHALEAGAPLEVLTFDPVQKEVVSVYTVDETPGWINQNPELLRMPDGTVYMYVDVQRGGTKERLGLHVYRSTDEGASFQSDPVFPQVGDFVFGYSFDDAVTSDGAAVMLAMSFPELPVAVRAVHAIRSADASMYWKWIRSGRGPNSPGRSFSATAAAAGSRLKKASAIWYIRMIKTENLTPIFAAEPWNYRRQRRISRR